jgi:hypothetical protein
MAMSFCLKIFVRNFSSAVTEDVVVNGMMLILFSIAVGIEFVCLILIYCGVGMMNVHPTSQFDQRKLFDSYLLRLNKTYPICRLLQTNIKYNDDLLKLNISQIEKTISCGKYRYRFKSIFGTYRR